MSGFRAGPGFDPGIVEDDDQLDSPDAVVAQVIVAERAPAGDVGFDPGTPNEYGSQEPPPAGAPDTQYQDYIDSYYSSGSAPYSPTPDPPSVTQSGYFDLQQFEQNTVEQGSDGFIADKTYYQQTDEDIQDWFTTQLAELADARLGPAPRPGEGEFYDVGAPAHGWFGTEAEQQRQYDYWKTAYDTAVARGDSQKIGELEDEIQRVSDSWTAYSGYFDEATHQWTPGRATQYAEQYQALADELAGTFGQPLPGEGMGGFSVDGLGRPVLPQAVPESARDRVLELVDNAAGDLTSSQAFLVDPTVANRVNREMAAAEASQFSDSLTGINAEADFLGRRANMTPDARQLEAQNLAYYQTQQNIQRGRSRVRPDQQGPDFGTTPYGPAPEPFLGGPVGDALSALAGLRHANLPVPAFRSSSTGLPSVRRGSATPEELFSGAAQPVVGGFNAFTDVGLPGIDQNVGDVLGAVLNKPAEEVVTSVTGIVRNLGQSGANLTRAVDALVHGRNSEATQWLDRAKDEFIASGNSSILTAGSGEQLTQERAESRTFLKEQPVVDLAGQLILDPWNYIGVGLVAKGVRAQNTAAKAGFFEKTMRDVLPTLDAAEVDAFKNLRLTWANNWRLKFASNRVFDTLTRMQSAGGESFARGRGRIGVVLDDLSQLRSVVKNVMLPPDEVVRIAGDYDLFAKRVVFRMELQRSLGAGKGLDPRTILEEEGQRLWSVLEPRLGRAKADLMLRPVTDNPDRLLTDIQRALLTHAPQPLPAQTQNSITLARMAGRERVVGLSYTPADSPLRSLPAATRLPRTEIIRSKDAPDIERIVTYRRPQYGSGKRVIHAEPVTRQKQTAYVVDETGQVRAYTVDAGVSIRQLTNGEGAPLDITPDGRLVTRGQALSETVIQQQDALPPLRPDKPVSKQSKRKPKGPATPQGQLPLDRAPIIPGEPVIPSDALRQSDAAAANTDALMERLIGLLPRVPKRRAALDGTVTAPQLRLIDFFDRRDATDLLATAYEAKGAPLTFDDVSQVIRQVHQAGPNGTGLATLAQLDLAARQGLTDQELLDFARLTRYDAQARLDASFGREPIQDVDTSGFMTPEQFRNWLATRPERERLEVKSHKQVTLAYQRGQANGVDLLRQWSEGQRRGLGFNMFINESYVKASPAQRRYVRSLQQQGLVPRTVDIETLTVKQADALIKGDFDSVDAMLRGVDAPLVAESAEDIAQVDLARQFVQQQDNYSTIFAQMLPSVTVNDPRLPEAARRIGRGRVVEKTFQGSPVPSPFMLQTIFRTELDSGRWAGSFYEGPMRDAVAALPWANQAAGARASGDLSRSTVDLAFEDAMQAITQIAKSAPPEESARFHELLHEAYYGDGVMAQLRTNEQAVAAKALAPDEFADIQQTTAAYQQSIPRLQTDASQREQRIAGLIESGAPQRQVEEEQRALLSVRQQIERQEGYLIQHAPDSPRMNLIQQHYAELQARAEQLRTSTLPDLPHVPAYDEPAATAAGPASTVDAIDNLTNQAMRGPIDDPVVPYHQPAPEPLERLQQFVDGASAETVTVPQAVRSAAVRVGLGAPRKGETTPEYVSRVRAFLDAKAAERANLSELSPLDAYSEFISTYGRKARAGAISALDEASFLQIYRGAREAEVVADESLLQYRRALRDVMDEASRRGLPTATDDFFVVDEFVRQAEADIASGAKDLEELPANVRDAANRLGITDTDSSFDLVYGWAFPTTDTGRPAREGWELYVRGDELAEARGAERIFSTNLGELTESDLTQLWDEYTELVNKLERGSQRERRAKMDQATRRASGDNQEARFQKTQWGRKRALEELFSDLETEYGINMQSGDFGLQSVQAATPANSALMARLRERAGGDPLDVVRVPRDPALLGPQRQRVLGETIDALRQRGSGDGEIAAALSFADQVALATVRNNPGKVPDTEAFYRNLVVRYGGESRPIDPTRSSHAALDPNLRGKVAAAEYDLLNLGTGLITLYTQGDAGSFVHELAHHLHEFLSAEQLAEFQRALGVDPRLGWRDQDLERFASSLEAYLGRGAVPSDLQLATGAFETIKRLLVSTYEFVARYLTPEQQRATTDLWQQTFDPTGRFVGGSPTSLSPYRQAGLNRRRGLQSVQPRRTVARPVVDPTVDMVRNVDWDTYGPAFDQWAERYYDHTDLLDDQRRIKLFGRNVNPLALTNMSRVMRVGDMTSLWLHSLFSELGEGLQSLGYTDYDTILDEIRAVVTGEQAEVLARNPFFQTKQGAEVYRVIKQYGQAVIDDFDHLVPAQSAGDLVQLGLLPRADNGRWTKAQLDRVDSLINDRGAQLPGNLTEEQRTAWRDWKAAYKDRWNEVVKPQYFQNGDWVVTDPEVIQRVARLETEFAQADEAYQAATKRLRDERRTIQRVSGRTRNDVQRANLLDLEQAADDAKVTRDEIERTLKAARRERNEATGVHVRHDLDPLLHSGEREQMVDLPKLADRIGSFVGSKFAEDINFDPDDIPWFLRHSLWVKGQLTPLWMTLWPGYHINNLAGNIMSQMGGSLRSDLSISRSQKIAQRWEDALSRPGSGIVKHPFLRSRFAVGSNESIRIGTELDDPTGRGLPRGIPSFLDWTTGGFRGEGKRGAITLTADTAEWVETRYKTVIYSQVWEHEYATRWEAELSRLASEGAISDADRLALLPKLGLDEIKATWLGDPVALGPFTREQEAVMAAQRKAIASANYKAYSDTREVLRDYRMRNKIDGMLDRFLPVHFWATKNMAFVTKTALDRPVVSLNAMQLYDAWANEMEERGLPLTFRTAYLPIPGKYVPFVDDDETWGLRLTSLTNPAVWAIPRIMGRMESYEDQSVGKRLQYWARDGVSAFWEESGYRLGPTWDWAIRGEQAIANNTGLMRHPALQRLDAALEKLQSPKGYRTNPLPFGGLEGVALRSQRLQGWYEYQNQFVYGSEYTRKELNVIGRMISEDELGGKLSDDPVENHAIAQRLIVAMWEGQYDDPELRRYIDRYWGQQNEGYVVSRLGASGLTYTESWKQSAETSAEYHALAETEGREEADRAFRGRLHPALRYLIDERNAGRMSDGAFEAAMTAAREGKPNQTLKLAWDKTQGQDVTIIEDAKFWEQLAKDASAYDELAADKGYDAANLWAFGWTDTTGKVRDAHAPWLSTYWFANGDEAKARESIQWIERDSVYQANQLMRDEYFATQNANSNAAAPYWDRISKAAEARDAALQRAIELGTPVTDANGNTYQAENMVLVEQAWRTYYDSYARIAAEASGAGISLAGSGRLPTHGGTFYDLMGNKLVRQQIEGTNEFAYYRVGGSATDEDVQRKAFLNANDALGAVDAYETSRAQRGYLLDLVKEQIHPDRDDEEFKNSQGEFDQQKYDKAVADAAEGANAVYREIVRELRGQGANIIDLGGVTPDDYRYHTRSRTPELDAWKAQRDKRIDAFFEMPGHKFDASDEQKAAVETERAHLVRDWGYDPYAQHRDYSLTDLVNLSPQPDNQAFIEARERGIELHKAHQTYTEGGKAIQSYYYTLTPKGKAEFKERYGHAFVTGEDGKDDFVPTQLSYEAVLDALARFDLTIDSDFADATEVTTRRPDGSIERSIRLGDTFERTREDGVTTGSPRGMLNRTAEDMSKQAARMGKTDFVYAMHNAYFDGAGMTDEQRNNRQQWKEFLDANSSLEKAAAELRGTDTPQEISWKKAEAKARDAGMYDLADYITARQEMSFTLKLGETYDAQQAWFSDLPADVQRLLIEEDPATFGRYADADTGGSGASGNDGTDTRGAGSTGRSAGSNRSSTRSSGGSTGYRPGSGGGGRAAGGASTPEVASITSQLYALDPLLAAGEDDGRGAIAQRIASIFNQYFIGYDSASGQMWGVTGRQFGDMFRLLQSAVMTWLAGQLGVSPTLETWQSLLNRLTGGEDDSDDPTGTALLDQVVSAAEAEAVAGTDQLPATPSQGGVQRAEPEPAAAVMQF